MKKLIVFAAALALLLPGSLLAQQNASGQRTDAITTAVPFLTISPDPRSGALGDAGVAVADDANATYWNMANLAFTEKQAGVNLSFSPWLRALNIPDIYHTFMPAYYNFGERGGVAGLSMRYFSLGNIQFTDESGIETGQFNANEFSLGGHYAHLITENLSVGGGLRFIYSNLVGAQNVGGVAQDAATSFSGDVSVAYQNEWDLSNGMPLGLNLGANISNIGAKMTYNSQTTERDFIPTNLRLGYALKFGIDDYNSVTFTNDFNKLMVPSAGGQSDKGLLSGMFGSFGDAEGGFQEEMQEFMMSFGLEYWYNDIFSVRGGYFWEAPNKGDRQFMTLGAGLKFKVFTLDFAYLVSFDNTHPLRNTLRFGLGLAFDS